MALQAYFEALIFMYGHRQKDELLCLVFHKYDGCLESARAAIHYVQAFWRTFCPTPLSYGDFKNAFIFTKLSSDKIDGQTTLDCFIKIRE